MAGVDSRRPVLPLGLALVGLLRVGTYDEVVSLLRYLLVGFVAYGAAAFLVHPDRSHLLLSASSPPVDATAGGGGRPGLARYHADQLRLRA